MTVGGRLLHARFRGCLIGHATGDALGAAVEFLSRPQILERFGPQGLETLEPWANDAAIPLPAGSITDDTQLTIATAEGLLAAFEQERSGVVWHPSGPVWERYLRWAKSQDDPHERRYPGTTTLSALESRVPGEMDAPLNDSKGSGGVMRVAPVGLAFPPDQAFEQGAEIAALTHGHPSGYLAGGFLADVVARLVRGASRGARDWNAARGGTLPGAIAETREVLLGYDDNDEVLEAVDHAVELYMADADLDTGFETLGEGWVAEEALAIGLFSALNFPEDFAEGVLAAVNITGDSDTTGCIAGALLGAMLGEAAVPADWALRIESAQRILGLADGLFESFIATPVE